MTSLHNCSTCNKAFGRLEHLRRHELSHSEKHFVCKYCSKNFSRKDGLQRHELTHRNSTNLVKLGSRACSACALAKARCSGDEVCERCRSKAITCRYPDRPVSSYQVQSKMASPQQHSPLTNNRELRSNFQARDQDTQHVTSSPEWSQQRQIPDADSNNGYSQAVFSNFRSPVGLHTESQTQIWDPPSSAESLFSPFNGQQWMPEISSSINWLSAEPTDHNFADFDMPFDTASSDPLLTFEQPLMNLSSTYSNCNSRAGENPAPESADAAMGQSSLTSPITSLQGQGSPTSMSQSLTGSGEYYVDGDGARLPKSKRRRIMSHSGGAMKANLIHSLACPPSVTKDCESTTFIGEAQYAQMLKWYRRLCIEPDLLTPFSSVPFVPRVYMNHLLELYLENIDQTLPMIHRSSFESGGLNFLVLTAAAALGSQMVEGDWVDIFLPSMHEFVRRLVMFMDEQEDLKPSSPKTMLQTLVLHIVGGLQSSDAKLMESALVAARRAASMCDFPKIVLEHSDQSCQATTDNGDKGHSIESEETLRVYYCVWLLDCMMAYQMQLEPQLGLHSVTSARLPCHERLWITRSETEWKNMNHQIGNAPEFLDALQNLFIEKNLLPGIGEFARILLVHGLFHRIWNVSHYHTAALSRFEPSAEKQSSKDLRTDLLPWSPAAHAVKRWRNAACDCVDILHWSANATIGAASGIEHPTVLFLHLARTVMLVPLAEIVNLAVFLTRTKHRSSFGPASRASVSDAEKYKTKIQHWVVYDQFKARLAAIHAGVLFWHVRRHSINGFYEPTAVAHSALMLWALSAFSAGLSSRNLTGGGSEPSSTTPNYGPANDNQLSSPSSMFEDMCTIILLDRPTDDELVQQFVKHGTNMRAMMTGVGDLFGPDGPQRVLRQSCKLLKTLGAWRATTQYWLTLLEKLEHVTAKASKEGRR